MDHAGDFTDHGDGDGRRGEKTYCGMLVTRLVFTILLSVIMPFLVSLFGIVAFACGAFFSNSGAVSIPTHCRILSSRKLTAKPFPSFFFCYCSCFLKIWMERRLFSRLSFMYFDFVNNCRFYLLEISVRYYCLTSYIV